MTSGQVGDNTSEIGYQAPSTKKGAQSATEADQRDRMMAKLETWSLQSPRLHDVSTRRCESSITSNHHCDHHRNQPGDQHYSHVYASRPLGAIATGEAGSLDG